MFFTICKRDKQWCAAKKSQWYSICRILTDTALSEQRILRAAGWDTAMREFNMLGARLPNPRQSSGVMAHKSMGHALAARPMLMTIFSAYLTGS